MWKISSELAKNWNFKEKLFVPTNIDIECPNKDCKRSLVNISLTWNLIDSYTLLSRCTCANCKKDSRFFLLNYPKDGKPESRQDSQIFLFPKPDSKTTFMEGVAEISESFVTIYSQAQEAEGLALTELVGVGYRKALEFLIKDYLINKSPEKEEEIKKMMLSKCISEFVDNPNIKKCATMAAWLGNDETHYVRTWPEHDLQDLKTLIELTQHWIAMEVITSKYEKEMKKQEK